MADPVHLGEDLITEILLRLPAKSVVRFRAVCKAWRRITTNPTFVSSHDRRRPLEVLLYKTQVEPGSALDTYNVDVELDALPVSVRHPPAQRRRLVRFPKNKARDVDSPGYFGEQYCTLKASCNGLLLFRRDVGEYLVCNPATRQWTDLPRLNKDGVHGFVHRESGFYFHQPSGEYRLMCYCSIMNGAVYYVLTAGADEPRRLNVQGSRMHNTIAALPGHSSFHFANLTPAALDGQLHWLRHPEAGRTDKMVAFDTVAETFRRMPAPPVTSTYSAKLLAMDGLLMASEFGDVFLDLWVVEDYGAKAERWEHRHRVVPPWQPSTFRTPLVATGGDEGDVILGTNRGLLVYNVKNETVRVVDLKSDDVGPSRHVLRESLVQHAFFKARPYPGLPLFRFS